MGENDRTTVTQASFVERFVARPDSEAEGLTAQITRELYQLEWWRQMAGRHQNMASRLVQTCVQCLVPMCLDIGELERLSPRCANGVLARITPGPLLISALPAIDQSDPEMQPYMAHRPVDVLLILLAEATVMHLHPLLATWDSLCSSILVIDTDSSRILAGATPTAADVSAADTWGNKTKYLGRLVYAVVAGISHAGGDACPSRNEFVKLLLALTDFASAVNRAVDALIKCKRACAVQTQLAAEGLDELRLRLDNPGEQLYSLTSGVSELWAVYSAFVAPSGDKAVDRRVEAFMYDVEDMFQIYMFIVAAAGANGNDMAYARLLYKRNERMTEEMRDAFDALGPPPTASVSKSKPTPMYTFITSSVSAFRPSTKAMKLANFVRSTTTPTDTHTALGFELAQQTK